MEFVHKVILCPEERTLIGLFSTKNKFKITVSRLEYVQMGCRSKKEDSTDFLGDSNFSNDVAKFSRGKGFEERNDNSLITVRVRFYAGE